VFDTGFFFYVLVNDCTLLFNEILNIGYWSVFNSLSSDL